MRDRPAANEPNVKAPDTLQSLLRQPRECGSAAFDAALWRATIDWLASRTADAQRFHDRVSRDE